MKRPRLRHSLPALYLLIAAIATAQAPPGLPSGDTWANHLTRDLLPFWSMPAALGTEPGAFPSTRCDNGSALDYSHPCPEVASNAWLMTPARYLVPLSRQTYGYGVAYHLTGDPKYLAWMKQGVDYIRRNAIDPTGGMFTVLDLQTSQWGPERELRNPQELAYGLLGLSFYYYLTRDETVLPDILAVRKYIFEKYYNKSIGAMQWILRDDGDTKALSKRLVADLDNLNGYMVLLTPALPDEQQQEWKSAARTLAHSMLSTYYSPRDNLLFTSADTQRDRDIAYTGTDFGHTIKSFWMLRWIGLMTGDDPLIAFATKNGLRLLERAWIPEDGSWATGVLAGGATDKNKNWWIYAELDQYAGSVALSRPEAANYLPHTVDYWLKNFVDKQYGEVWNGVDYGANTPQRYLPKAWPWKSAYHSFEHALVGYITSEVLYGRTVTLHYAFQIEPPAEKIRPYFFDAPVASITRTSDGANKYQAVTFRAPAIPAAQDLTVVSGASFLPQALTPGSIASAFGVNLSKSTAVAESTPLPTTLAGTVVGLFDSAGSYFECPLFYVSPTQINFQIPPGAKPGEARVQATTVGLTPVKGAVKIAPVSPGIFQANAVTGLAAATIQRLKADGTMTYEYSARLSGNEWTAAPVDLGPEGEKVYLGLYATGIRGARETAAFVGGQPVPVLYHGAQGQYVGLDQINVGPLPRSLAGAGRVNVLIEADGQTAAPVEITIK